MTVAPAMEIENIKTPAGIEAWLVEEHTVPMMAVCFAFEGGAVQDPIGLEGLAQFVGSMLLHGAGEFSMVEYQEKLEDLAVRIGFVAGLDTVGGTIELLSEDRMEAARLLRLAFARPRFEPAETERLRQLLQLSNARSERQPGYVAMTEWFAKAFAGHPYARPISGTHASIAEIGPDCLASHSRRLLTRDKLKVVVVGNVTPDELIEFLDEVFGDLPSAAERIEVPDTRPARGGEVVVADMKSEQSAVLFGTAAIRPSDPDYTAACVLTHIIGGKQTSRLRDEVRHKRGLAHAISTDLLALRHASVFLGSVSSSSQHVDALVDIIRSVVPNTARELSRADLEDAVGNLVGTFPLDLNANAKIAGRLLTLWVRGIQPDLEARKRRLAQVTLDDLHRVSDRLFGADDLFFTVAGPRA